MTAVDFPDAATWPDVDTRTRRLTAAAVLTTVDAVSTYLLLAGGHATEANPALAALTASAGPAVAMAVRWTVGMVLLAALAAVPRDVDLARHGTTLVVVALAGVAVWHLRIWTAVA